MKIEIPCGKGRQVLDIESAFLKACLMPAHGENIAEDEARLVRSALENPIGSPRLCELARGKNNIVLITSDHTRPLPSAITLPLLLEEIRRGSPEAKVTILIATGVHRDPTEAEMRAKFGDAIFERETLAVHHASNQEEMACFGVLPSGGELWLNRRVGEADLVISEGFVEPHFFAGYSGGRKSILPGVAARRTILYNHNARFIADLRSRQGSLAGNPIHEDMVFAARAAKLAFTLSVLLNGEKRIIAAFAGDMEQSHQAACRLCDMQCGVPVALADIVITSNGGYPLDQNIYQCVKGLTAAEACVRDGGVIILCAGLGDGHGGESFYHWFADRGDAAEVLRDIQDVPPEETRMDQWQAQIMARVMLRARCVFVAPEKNRQTLEDMHFGWADDVNKALKMAREMVGDDASVTVIPDGVGVIVKA